MLTLRIFLVYYLTLSLVLVLCFVYHSYLKGNANTDLFFKTVVLKMLLLSLNFKRYLSLIAVFKKSG